ncbi:amidohydrolase family protein [Methanobrevibacter arboriphilus]
MNPKKFNSIKANILDVFTNEIYPSEISIEDGYIVSVNPISNLENDGVELDFDGILVPGFIDAHIHIESSLLTPSNFAKAVVPFGTTSVIADPHEIANVAGIEGVEFMIDDASKVPFDFYFSAPSCVPATNFETSGACLDSLAIEELLKMDEVVSLGEVMNFVGVINNDKNVIDKLKVAKKYNIPIDGHAPLLSGADLEKYVNVF